MIAVDVPDTCDVGILEPEQHTNSVTTLRFLKDVSVPCAAEIPASARRFGSCREDGDLVTTRMSALTTI